jgi:broad specificity phosphatase PhoE
MRDHPGGGRRIHLARHAPSVADRPDRFDSSAWRGFLASYDTHGLREDVAIEPDLIRAASASVLLIHGPLRRAVETVDLLRRAMEKRLPAIEVWPEIAEAPQPAPHLPALRLTQDGWDVLTRCAWLLGACGGVEPRAEANRRAGLIADRLTAGSASPVLVIGHGFQNVLIARALRARGWRGPRWPDHRHTRVTTYRFGPSLQRQAPFDGGI